MSNIRDYIPLTVCIAVLAIFTFIVCKALDYQAQVDMLNGVPPPCLKMGLCQASEYPYLKGTKWEHYKVESSCDRESSSGLHYGTGNGFYMTNKGVEYKAYSATPGLKLN